MNRTRKATLAVMTVAAAGLTGHVMQNVAAPDHPARGEATASLSAPDTRTSTEHADTEMQRQLAAINIAPGRKVTILDPALPREMPQEMTLPADVVPPEEATPEIPQPELTAADIDSPPRDLPVPEPGMPRMALADFNVELPEEAEAGLSTASGSGDECGAELSLVASPAAMIDLALDAPCHPNTPVVLRHAGLAFTALTDDAGALDLHFPALAEQAVITLDLRGGPDLRGEVAVPDMADFDRVVMQWQGEDSFQLNAYEFGAPHGAPGHVSSARPGTPDGEGGFLVALGDDRVDWPLFAEVYSFPTGTSGRDGEVTFTIEAALTPQTCGREMLGEALELREGRLTDSSEITLPMPDCEEAGGFLVLKNLIPDMKIAGN